MTASRFDQHAERRPDAVPVVFIGATGRCGTTLMDRILGQHDDVFGAGEVNRLWEFGLRGRAGCGCGRPLTECDIWAAVLEEAYGSVEHAIAAAEANSPSERLLGSPNLPRTLGPLWPRYLAGLSDFAAQVERVYRAIVRVTGCRVVVDASKHALFAAMVRSHPGVDMRLLHMIRDPRASAYSWSRPKPDRGDGSGERMWHAGPVRTTASWVLLNRDHRLFGKRHPDRYRLVRYEDFVAAPRDALGIVSELIADVDGTAGPIDFANLVDDGDPPAVQLAATHPAWGNPNRFDTGRITITEDTRWRAAMTRADRAKAMAVAAPALRHYGYPI